MNGNKPHTEKNDEELLQAYRSSGDKNLLGVLLQRYTLLLLGVAMKYLKDKDQAQDAVQQVFLKTLTNLPAEPILNFKGWLYILMRNHCLQQLRDRNYSTGNEGIEGIAGEPELNRDELIAKDQTLEQMKEALEELNEEQKNTITLFYLQKKSYQQIMDITGFSFMQVKSYIQNGKRNLKLILTKKMGNGQK